jgi:hypothetical protein
MERCGEAQRGRSAPNRPLIILPTRQIRARVSRPPTALRRGVLAAWGLNFRTQLALCNRGNLNAPEYAPSSHVAKALQQV